MTIQVPTWLLGLVGRGIGSSKSACIHQTEAAAQGLQLVYRVIDFDQIGCDDGALDKILALAENIGFAGLNITHPYKQHIMEYLDTVAPDAEALGAVNTVTFSNGKRRGYNTDWSGFAQSTAAQFGDLNGTKIAQIGAGGAGSATAYALLKSGATEVAIYDSDNAKCKSLVERLAPHFVSQKLVMALSAPDAILGADGIVQASPVGMDTHPGMPFDPNVMTIDQWLADIIYFPRETPLVKAALKRQVRAIGGSAMVVYQAAEAFEIFTGHPPDTARMLQDFESRLIEKMP